MSFRKERKFRLTAYDARALKAQLLGRGMTLLHPNRKISSQYFDSLDLRAFEDSEEGVLPRYKIRVRWYNDDQSSLTLEKKTSSVEGRYKTTEAITTAEFEKISRDGLPGTPYGRVIPTVVISYRRSYFNYERLRITFDTDILYTFGSRARQFREFEEVVEIKVPFEVSDNYLENLVTIPASRFSKYGRSHLRIQKAI